MAEDHREIRNGEYRIGEGTERIADLEFAGTDGLERMFIPDSVKEIGNYAFMNCYSLREIRMPEELDGIGAGVFQNCWQLRELSLPEGVVSIGGEFLENCHALTILRLPSTLSQVTKSAFSRCRNLKKIYIDPSQIEILPASAKYSAVLTFMEEHAGDTAGTRAEGAELIDSYAAERQKSLLDLAINRKSAAAVRYMTSRGLLTEAALREYLERSAASGRVEITAVLLDGLEGNGGSTGLNKDPFVKID